MKPRLTLSILLSLVITGAAVFCGWKYLGVFGTEPKFSDGSYRMVERLPGVPVNFKAVYEVIPPANQLVVNVSSREEVFKAAEGGTGYVSIEHFRWQTTDGCVRLCYLVESGGKWIIFRNKWATDDFPGPESDFVVADNPYVSNGVVVRNISASGLLWTFVYWALPIIAAVIFLPLAIMAFYAKLGKLARPKLKILDRKAA
jgi:hypothetical protein